jgi:4-aminobutyrate aminotransferase-like enzyme
VSWARAEGCRVWDERGRKYLDLSGGFGVAALGTGARLSPRPGRTALLATGKPAIVAFDGAYHGTSLLA